MPQVVLGNTAPLNARKPDPASDAVETSPLEIDNGREDNWTETTFVVPADRAIDAALAEIRSAWTRNHSDDSPAWVESDDPVLAQFIARAWATPDHEVLVGKPKGWDHGPAKGKS